MADKIENTGAPSSVSARLDHADGLSFVIATLVALAAYLFTLAPEVTLTWSGVMSTCAMYCGVGPTPGYYAWTAYSWLFIKLLPFSNIAWRVAVGSAVAGAIVCGLVAVMVAESGKFLFHNTGDIQRFSVPERNFMRVVCSCVAGLGLGFSQRFWYEAVIQEFWTFTVLLFVIVVWLLIRWMETRGRLSLWLMFFVYGLLLTSDQELIILLPGIVCAMMLVELKLGRDVALAVLSLGAAANWMSGYPTMAGFSRDRPVLTAFATALLLALVMTVVTREIGKEWRCAPADSPLRRSADKNILRVQAGDKNRTRANWGYARTAEGFFHVISRGQYGLPNPTSNFSRFVVQVWWLLKGTGNDVGWLYLVFALLPMCRIWKTTASGQKWILGMLLISLCVGPLLAQLLNPGDDSRNMEGLLGPYFFCWRALVALWAGIGLMIFAAMIARPKARN